MNVDITGARIYCTIPVLGGIPITATMVDSLLVTLIVLGLCAFLTRGLQLRAVSKRQVVAEFLVETAQNFVNGNMGVRFAYYGPFVAALFVSPLMGSLLSLVGLFPPTGDVSTTLAWALMVFVLITYNKIRAGGVGGYLLGFTQPIPLLTPFNILSELATPISMAFRHFGNIVSGTVITSLLYAALAAGSAALMSLLGRSILVAGLVLAGGIALLFKYRSGKAAGAAKFSHKLFGIVLCVLGGLACLSLLPAGWGEMFAGIPVLQAGIPAVFSVYFDLFSSAMQAFIFCMLTTLYIANAAEG